MQREHSGSPDTWKVCRDLGTHKDFEDTDANRALLAYAVARCDRAALPSVLEEWRKLQRQPALSTALADTKSIPVDALAAAALDARADDKPAMLAYLLPIKKVCTVKMISLVHFENGDEVATRSLQQGRASLWRFPSPTSPLAVATRVRRRARLTRCLRPWTTTTSHSGPSPTSLSR